MMVFRVPPGTSIKIRDSLALHASQMKRLSSCAGWVVSIIMRGSYSRQTFAKKRCIASGAVLSSISAPRSLVQSGVV